MTRDPCALKDRIPTAIAFMFSSISQKAAKTSTRFKFSVLVGLKKNKASTSKDFEGSIVWGYLLKTFKRRDVVNNQRGKLIDSVGSSESSFSPCLFWARGKEKHGTNNV